MNRSIMDVARDMGSAVERMIRLLMEAYPEDWSDADKRELAERQLGLRKRP